MHIRQDSVANLVSIWGNWVFERRYHQIFFSGDGYFGFVGGDLILISPDLSDLFGVKSLRVGEHGLWIGMSFGLFLWIVWVRERRYHQIFLLYEIKFTKTYDVQIQHQERSVLWRSIGPNLGIESRLGGERRDMGLRYDWIGRGFCLRGALVFRSFGVIRQPLVGAVFGKTRIRLIWLLIGFIDSRILAIMVRGLLWREFPLEILSQSLTHENFWRFLRLLQRDYWRLLRESFLFMLLEYEIGKVPPIMASLMELWIMLVGNYGVLHEVTKRNGLKWFQCTNHKRNSDIYGHKNDRNKYDRYRIFGVIDGCNCDRVGCLSISTRICFVFFHTQLFLQYPFSHCYCLFSLLLRVGGMAQLNFMKAGGSNKGKATLKPTLKITVARFDNSQLIKGYSKTLIGRCMNPQKQDMKALLYMLPRIWHVEGKVAAADLGLGRFQFDFDEEQDIIEVLKMAPFHFDYWMLSVVRWQPVMDPQYPSEIMFWVRVLGVPLQYWAIPTFESIGDALGEAKEVDLDGGRVQVLMNAFQPLVFETTVGFDNGGEETTILLRYERLYGFCKECHSMCHAAEQCPLLLAQREEKERVERAEKERQRCREEKSGMSMMSYKGVVLNGVKEGDDSRHYHGKTADYKGKGKGKMVETRENRGHQPADFRGKAKLDGEGTSSLRVLPVEQGKRYGGPVRGISRGGDDHTNEQTNHENENGRERGREEGPTETMSDNHLSAKKARITEVIEPQHGTIGKTLSSLNQAGNKVRKELKFDDDDEGIDLETLMVEPAEAVTGYVTESRPETVMVQMRDEENMGPRRDDQTLNGESTTMNNDIDFVQGSDASTDVVVANDNDNEGLKGMELEENKDMTLFGDDDGEELHEADEDLGLYDQPLANAELPAEKPGGARKPTVKKKGFRPAVGLGGGTLRRMAQTAKTPRKKQALKEPKKKKDDGSPKGPSPDTKDFK